MQAEYRLSDDAQCAKRSCGEFGQVVSCDVLYDLASALCQRAIGQRQIDPNYQIAQGSKTRAQRATVIRS